MPALDAGGKFAPGTFEEEADSAWGSILAIAAASGCGPADILYIQVLLADIGNYGDLNTWWPGGGASPPDVPGGRAPVRGQDRTAGGSRAPGCARMTAQRAVPRETVDTYLPANRLGMTHHCGMTGR